MVAVRHIGLSSERLEELRPLLSEESFQNISKYRKELEKDPPPLKGSGVYNAVYNARNDRELQEQNFILKDRIDWIRKLYLLQGLRDDFLTQENRKLKKENQQLKQETEELQNELKRAHNQLHLFLGISKKKMPTKDGGKEKDSRDTKSKDDDNHKKKKRGAPIGHEGRNRPIPDKVDKVEEILPPPNCPHCGSRQILIKNGYTSKYIEDIVDIIRKVIEKRYIKGCCSNCSHEVISSEAFSGPQVVLGPNIVTLLTIMRQQMGVSYRKLGRFCTETLKIPLSQSGVLGVINRVCTKLEPIYKAIEVLLRKQEVLFGDETGWRMDGDRWYMWCFCNRHLKYFHANKSRGSKVPKAILGEEYPGILHADFYAAYNFIKKTQRCLIHLQRNIKNELEIVPADKSLILLEQGIKKIIKEGNEIKLLSPSPEKDKKRKKVEEKLHKLTQLKSKNKKTSNFIKRIDRYKDHLLRFIDHPQIEHHNNRAERAIRPMVIFRKTSFGNRTPKGAYNHALFLSSLETARANKKNLTAWVKRIYKADSKEIKKITRTLLDTS
jgi:hypothetical protein